MAGYGKQGYCKLCSIEDPKMQDQFDRRTGAKKGKSYEYTPADLNEWLAEKGLGIQASRPTVYEHRKHVMHPKDRLVQAVQKREIDHGSVPANVTDDEFTQTIIALGQRRALENPDEVTIDQALKATQIRQNRKDKGNAQAVLVNIFTGGPSGDPVIEGEVKEV